jgi:hypothetical protein
MTKKASHFHERLLGTYRYKLRRSLWLIEAIGRFTEKNQRI